jgi:hypothetical protein
MDRKQGDNTPRRAGEDQMNQQRQGTVTCRIFPVAQYPGARHIAEHLLAFEEALYWIGRKVRLVLFCDDPYQQITFSIFSAAQDGPTAEELCRAYELNLERRRLRRGPFAEAA